MREFFLLTLALLFIPLILITLAIRLFFPPYKLTTYLKTAAIGIDQLGGSILYSRENWTVSSYTHYLCVVEKVKPACLFEKVVNFFFGTEHCRKAFEWESRKDAAEAIEMRKKYGDAYELP